MANYRTFHSQLTSIMDTLTRAAVAEICELVDDGYAVLHIEISRHQKENDELRQKLQLIESIIARGAGGGPAAADKSLSARDSRGREGLMREARGKALIVAECMSRDMEDGQPITVQIKQEQQEDHGTGRDGDGGDVISQDSLGEDVEEVLSEAQRVEGDTHTHSRSDSLDTHTHSRSDRLDTHTHSRSDRLDTHTHSRSHCLHTHTHSRSDSLDTYTHSCSANLDTHGHSCSDSDTHTHSGTHTHPALDPSSAVLLETDEDNTHSHSDVHTDSDTHTHSDAFSDTHTPSDRHTHTHSDAFSDTHTPSDTKAHADTLADTHAHTHNPDTHADTHSHALSFLDRVCMKREAGVCELVADWRSRTAVLAHTHHALTHTHTHALPSGFGGGGTHPPLYSPPPSAGLMPHAHTHTHTHTHRRSFICVYCGKSFTTAQSLDTHTRIHTGERPFRCGQCGKRFTQSGHLTAHQTVHTGERPHPCAFCSKRFAGKQYLRIHMKKHHPDQQQHA